MKKDSSQERKPRRQSILRKLVVMFIVAIAVSCIGSFAVSLTTNYIEIRNKSYENSDEASRALDDIIKRRGGVAGYLEIDSSNNMTLAETMRYLCLGYDLQYMYLFTLDEENSDYHYIMTVASDERDNEIVRKERGLGTIVHVDDLHQSVIDANHGKKDSTIISMDNKYGRVIGWVYPLEAEYEGRRVLLGADCSAWTLERRTLSDTVNYSVSTFVVLVLLSGVMLVVTHKKVVEPVGRISESMRSFTDNYGKHEEKIEIRDNSEIGEIAQSFNIMSDDIHRLIEDNAALNEVQTQAKVQLDVARRIQCGVVPERLELNEDSYSISAFVNAAKSVGGDFYDSFLLDDSHVCIVIGDVSGKGITAALFMIMVKTMLREKMRSGTDPAQVLNAVNDEICASNPEALFATVFAAVLDLQSGELTFANAGHNPPVLFREKPSFLSTETGIALGVFEDAGIVTETVVLGDGDGLLLYTDGVTEAVDKDDNFYGDERLLKACEGCTDSAGTVEAVRSSVYDYYDGRAHFDDLTMISVFFRKPAQIDILPQLSEMSRIIDLIKTNAKDAPGFKKTVLACEEIFTNICSYSGAKRVRFSCKMDDDKLRVIFTDDGSPFNPLTPQEEKDFDELDEGGMGLSLVRQIAEKIKYDRKDGENILEMEFSPYA